MRAAFAAVLIAKALSSSPDNADPVYPAIKYVHVINSCHLDIGFVKSSADIINLYFDHHFPLAASVGNELRSGVPGFTDTRLNFMFQSWVIDLYFDCPPGMGLHCPSVDNMTVVRRAIEKGDITWHAFPHNAQLEIMGKSLIKAGLMMTRQLDYLFAQNPKRVLSQRDVPGMTRALIPLLKSQYVTAISIGANGGSTPPDLPPCFVWADAQTNSSILGLFTWPGYGSLPVSSQKPCIVDGLEHALVYNWNGDNKGPSEAADYGKSWQMIAKTFPNAAIMASTFDNFVHHLEKVQDRLPVVDKEIGDTWIYGVPSDPQKVSRMRVINSAYEELDKQGRLESMMTSDAVLRNATRFALKNGEHTWGKDVKTYLYDDYSWKNKDFSKARMSTKNGSQYAALESSWWEQRHWGITLTTETLLAANHSMADVLLNGFADLQPKVPSIEGYKVGSVGEVYQCGSTEIGFDSFGAISHLAYDDAVWADDNHTLLQMKYRSYSADDVDSFFSQYCMSNQSWVQKDYGKPGLPRDVKGKLWLPTLSSLHVKAAGKQCSFVLQITYDPEASEEYGAASGWSQIDVSNGAVSVSIGMFNKSATRIPEAMFVQFKPIQNNGVWSVNKLGSWIRSDDVIDGGAKHLHGNTHAGIRLDTAEKSLFVSAADAAVVNFGELNAYPSPVHSDPDTLNFGASFVLWDNLWGTNYVMWWPFVVPPPEPYGSSSAYFPSSWNNDMMSRFQITFKSQRNEINPVWV